MIFLVATILLLVLLAVTLVRMHGIRASLTHYKQKHSHLGSQCPGVSIPLVEQSQPEVRRRESGGDAYDKLFDAIPPSSPGAQHGKELDEPTPVKENASAPAAFSSSSRTVQGATASQDNLYEQPLDRPGSFRQSASDSSKHQLQSQLPENAGLASTSTSDQVLAVNSKRQREDDGGVYDEPLDVFPDFSNLDNIPTSDSDDMTRLARDQKINSLTSNPAPPSTSVLTPTKETTIPGSQLQRAAKHIQNSERKEESQPMEVPAKVATENHAYATIDETREHYANTKCARLGQQLSRRINEATSPKGGRNLTYSP